MPATLIGRKIGMTRVFSEDGGSVPVTVIQAGPCAVTQVKTTDNDGYSAVQIAFEEVKASRTPMSTIGHDGKAGVAPMRFHREMRLENDKQAGEFTLGQTLDVGVFENIKFVDVIGTSKGAGFQGVMVRWGFKGLCASHGTERKHRSRGTISARATNRGWGPKPKKGMGQSGQMGNERVSIRNLNVISIDKDKNLLLVKGPVPGPNQGMVMIAESKRLGRSKQNIVKGGAKKK